ncbi:interferon epsilon-like [Protobothrops mucrosquamatus]|uniref:interferon epsilon-like n=1 Tax=Protobothrops mucrosquamatus TaxID=103944 RepID=UPI0010FB21EF|nr:interferon epsilon-like [Protobothrops mucrosquamatus]
MSTMTTRYWCLFTCLGIFLTEISSQDCNQLRSRLHETNLGNLNLLTRNIGSTIPQQCIRDIIDSSLYTSEENLMNMVNKLQGENAKVAIKELLQQIGLIFKESHSELVWDENSLREFHIGLDQEVKKTETCWNTEVERGIRSPRCQKLQFTRLRVKRYFQRLRDFLKNKEYNLCAWKVIQIQIRECFEWINQLNQRIPSEGT